MPGTKLDSTSLTKTLTADGSNIADWATMTTPTYKRPAGPFQVHFYQNKVTGTTYFGRDFKVVFNHDGVWP